MSSHPNWFGQLYPIRDVMDQPILFNYHFYLLTHLHDRILLPHLKSMDAHASYGQRIPITGEDGEFENGSYAVLSRAMVVVGTVLER